jgi:putative FmdB family regulatory protein
LPLYEYICEGCALRFEQLVNGSERPACPSCGSRRLEKQISVFAVGGGRETGAPPAGSCGTCGDPRGPGSCADD